MALKQHLDQGDMALALIVQDPILFPEFLRSTKDGNKNKDVWPKKRFTHRWYQRDLLSDRSPDIVLQGGRSIGKCHIGSDRVYTDQGYKPIRDLIGRNFRVWAFNGTDLELRRAVCTVNLQTTVYRIQTQSGNIVTVTKDHPLFTSHGWKLARDIAIHDRIATLTRLPPIPTFSAPNHEATFMGITLFKDLKNWRAVTQYKSSSIPELEYTARMVRTSLKPVEGGYMWRSVRARSHPIYMLFGAYGFNLIRKWGWVQPYKLWHIPREIMQFSEENLHYFLGALLSEYADISTRHFRLRVPSSVVAKDLQELFLRLGIETRITAHETTEYRAKKNSEFHMIDCYLESLNHRAAYRAIKTLHMPGYRAGNIKAPEYSEDPTDFYRYDPVVAIEIKQRQHTYNVQVEGLQTYICENLINHNSFVLEDKMIFDIVNHRTTLEDTKELLLTTANQNQMTPLLDKFVSRFLSSPLLKPFAEKGMNRQTGMMKFQIDGLEIKMHARIAGGSKENNVIGLHLPRIYIDEGQVYSLAAFRQLQPVLNFWEQNTQIFVCGVPNSISNSTLYQLAEKTPRFKKYKIPAPNNPVFRKSDYDQAIKDYNGEDSDLFKNLVLGQNGQGSEQVLFRDDITVEAHEFYTFRYTNQHKDKGGTYATVLGRPQFNYSMYIAAIDTGFVDPTVIQIFGLKNGRWYLIARYNLQRIEYPEQELIINWLHDFYRFQYIYVDIGSGGGGATIIQSLMFRPEYKDRKYHNVIKGITFNEQVLIGYDDIGREIKQDTKSVGAARLVELVQTKQLIIAELDGAAMSQLERIAKQKNMNGSDSYFILSETGRGKARDDHIFASFICFAFGTRDQTFIRQKKKLGKSI